MNANCLLTEGGTWSLMLKAPLPVSVCSAVSLPPLLPAGSPPQWQRGSLTPHAPVVATWGRLFYLLLHSTDEVLPELFMSWWSYSSWSHCLGILDKMEIITWSSLTLIWLIILNWMKEVYLPVLIRCIIVIPWNLSLKQHTIKLFFFAYSFTLRRISWIFC